MTLVALQYPDKKRAAILFPYLSMISEVQFRALRAYIDSEPAQWDPATANINHAYIAIKLWILLAGRITADSAERELTTVQVWNALWPPFESLAFNMEKQTHLHAVGFTGMTSDPLLTCRCSDIGIAYHVLHSGFVHFLAFPAHPTQFADSSAYLDVGTSEEYEWHRCRE
jgi:hypothetical protein